MQRNESEDGGMVYKFHCDKGFRLNGSSVIHCRQGQWNGSTPRCESNVAGVTFSGTSWHISAAIPATVFVVVVAVIPALLCFLRRRRKCRKRSINGQARKGIKRDVVFSGSFNNPAYVSSDLK